MSTASNPPDLLVIGGGVGGYTAAIRAAREGMSVTLIEGAELGGTCLNLGCIPTKSLLHQAHLYREAATWRAFGLEPGMLRLDFRAVAARKDQVVDQLTKGVQTLVRKNRIELIQGMAEFVDARTVRVRESGALVHAQRVLIATGSQPVLPPIPGMGLPGVVTSDGALAMTGLPGSVLIIGGGVIGVEFAQIFSDFGSQVTVVEQLGGLLLQEDEEIVQVLHKRLVDGGVTLHLQTRVTDIREAGGQLEVSLSGAGGLRTLAVDTVLVAVGRRPCVQGLGLERIGVRLDQAAIATDEFCRSSLPHVYAVGDVRGGPLLAQKAAADAECAVAHMLGHARSTVASVIPRAVYTWPEIASVGMTEAEARSTHAEVKVGRFPFSANGKALTMGQGQGLVKLVADAATDQILGIAMVGPDVTSLLGEATLAVQMELTLPALMQTVHAHPTLTEALMEAAHDAFDGGAIHLPPRTRPAPVGKPPSFVNP